MQQSTDLIRECPSCHLTRRERLGWAVFVRVEAVLEAKPCATCGTPTVWKTGDKIHDKPVVT